MASPDQPAVPEVRLDQIQKHYGDVVAVDGVSLEILPGEFFSLLGPSGCGKTTTLRMIGGFEIPTGGRILLRDRDVTREPPDRRAVNMVFQHYALFPHLTVGDNIAFGPKRQGLPKDEIGRRVADGLALVHLEGYEKRKPHQLSGGQQQRVALARALANRPNVLLLDEPLGALDLKLRRQLQVELKRIQAEVGITFIYVTHDQEEALTMSDRIAVMNAGHVEQLGTPEDLYERPATRFVADFMGTTNLLRGTVGTDGRVRLETGETIAADARGHSPGATVDVSVRPESARIEPVSLSVAPTPVAPTGLAGCVEQAAYLGSSLSYLVRTHDGLGVSVLVAKEGPRLPVGSEVVVSWSPEAALVLGSGPVPALEVQP
jgi:spermidine/putrescine transport system ATP-binding protein